MGWRNNGTMALLEKGWFRFPMSFWEIGSVLRLRSGGTFPLKRISRLAQDDGFVIPCIPLIPSKFSR
jgi:hypothetical protein